MQEACWMGSRSGWISLYLSKQISNAAVVQHWARSVSGQTVAAGCSGTLIKPVSKEKPENQNRFIETVSCALVAEWDFNIKTPFSLLYLKIRKDQLKFVFTHLTLKQTWRFSSVLNTCEGGYQKERSADAKPNRPM